MRVLILISIFFLTNRAPAQNTFNIRTSFGYPAALAAGVIPTDSCIYISGIILDTIYPNPIASFFSKLDTIGNLQFQNKISSPFTWHDTRVPAFVATKDGGFGLAGIEVDSFRRILSIKYTDNGDTLYLRNYLHPLYPLETFVYVADMELTIDNGFLIVGNLEMQQGTNNTDILILKTDSLGNEIFIKNIGTTSFDELSSCVIRNGQGYIIGAKRDNTNVTTQDYTYRTLLVGIDSAGNVQWTWLSPESWGLRDAARDMVLLDDGSLVIASGIGHEQQRPSVNVVYFDKAVFKLNPQKELVWEVVFPDSVITSNSYTTNIIKLSNGSGFIISGISTTILPPPEWGAIEGWIVKLGEDGETKWIRKHVYLTASPGYHKINDLKECPDGGLIICGEARELSDTASIPQQAWLMKLYSFGCLVPGCQLVDATEESKEMGSLLLYPNPARDYLNFFYRPAPGQPAGQTSFRIFDASGHELHRFEAQAGEATYTLPLWHWPPGVYFLQLLQNGLPVKTERFVVER